MLSIVLAIAQIYLPDVKSNEIIISTIVLEQMLGVLQQQQEIKDVIDNFVCKCYKTTFRVQHVAFYGTRRVIKFDKKSVFEFEGRR